jgi:ribonuclease Z
MLPKPPPRETAPGFLYLPPFRVYGVSIAGESTCIQIPELDICFDMGECLRPSLAAKFVAISHGHMDHIGALAYYCSQRRFQGMGTGKIVCDARIAGPINRMMAGFVDLEQQRTPFELFPLEPEQMLEIKPSIHLRAFQTEHTCPSFGYVVVEKRSKLKPEFAEFPQEKLRELKEKGQEITRTLEIPLVAYLGDTSPGPHLLRSDVRKAEIVICECTFFEPDHVERAKVGMHMHVKDIAEWVRFLECKHLILTHVSRRTHLGFAREQLTKLIGEAKAQNVFLLMDNKFNRDRYEKQELAAGIVPTVRTPRPPPTAAPGPAATAREENAGAAPLARGPQKD